MIKIRLPKKIKNLINAKNNDDVIRNNLIISKNIRSGNKKRRFFRIETFDTSHVLSKIKSIRGLSVLAAQSNSIIVSQSVKSIPLSENKLFNNIKSINSIHVESDLIEYYYA